jgi:hypothetical protein
MMMIMTGTGESTMILLLLHCHSALVSLHPAGDSGQREQTFWTALAQRRHRRRHVPNKIPHTLVPSAAPLGHHRRSSCRYKDGCCCWRPCQAERSTSAVPLPLPPLQAARPCRRDTRKTDVIELGNPDVVSVRGACWDRASLCGTGRRGRAVLEGSNVAPGEQPVWGGRSWGQ